jgi:hypothetical protein
VEDAAAAAATAANWLVEEALLAAAIGELLRWMGYIRVGRGVDISLE